MRKSILSTVVALGLAGGLTACDTSQPPPRCIVQDASAGNWFARYEVVQPPTGANCTGVTPLVGGEWGVWKFADPKADTATLVIRPVALAALGQFDNDNTYQQLQATANLAQDPDSDYFCPATDFSLASVNANQGTYAGANARAVSYQFNNVKVYSRASAPGTQMTGELTYTVNGCVSTYVFNAMWPATHCDPTLDPADETNGPDTCGRGSGLNPDFDVVCDEATEYCTLAKTVPSFKANSN
jgi:hypothetical protein